MSARRSIPLLIVTIVALMLLVYAPSGAADDNHVALVIDYGNGQVATRCVAFAEESITGHAALERSGLPIETDFQTGGAAVCRIDGQGCPAADCFCQCRGGDNCVYWSYWHLTGGAWQYALGGAGQYQVTDGMVDGWVWGLGSVTQAPPPPLVSFAEVCAAAPSHTPTVTVTPSRTATPVILPTALPTGDGSVATTAPTIANPTAATSATTVATVSPAATGAVQTSTRPATAATTIAATSTAVPSSAQSTTLPIVDAPTAITILLSPTAAVTNAPTRTAPPTTSDRSTSDAIQPIIEPTGGLLDPVTAASPSGGETTAVVAVVIGADAIAAPAAPVASAGPSTVDWPAYAGFAGLLALLGALALVVARRRGVGG